MARSEAVKWGQAEQESAIARLERDGTFAADKARIDGPLLDRILKAASKRRGRPVFNNARFDGASFETDARFSGVSFEGQSSFRDVRFQGPASFRDATFQEETRFEGAVFGGFTDITGATFRGNTSFARATFAEQSRFDHARFLGEAGFGKTDFQGDASFAYARFFGNASFRRGRFAKETTFRAARFRGGARFREATFAGWTSFSKVSFLGEAGFREASFTESAQFGEAIFAAVSSFQEAAFGQAARFESTTFREKVSFDGARFVGDLLLRQTIFESDAFFTNVAFERSLTLGPSLAFGQVAFDRSIFADRVQISLSARRLSCVRTRFRGGASLYLRWSGVLLEEAQFEEPSILAGSARFEGMKDARLARAVAREGESVSARPTLFSLRRADVANLVLVDLDLRACRFAGAHNLDRLRLEGGIGFARPPRGWRWTRRQTLGEEHCWRAEHARGRRSWAAWGVACGLPDWVKENLPDITHTLGAQEIAGIYRSLRKGREDNRDEPGSADFYYGEMEMRRQPPARSPGRAPGRLTQDRGERAILWMYWLVSGYGLRASRALIGLVVTVLVFATLFDAWGFAKPQSLTTALLFSLEGTTSLLRGTDRDLTTLGETLWIALRLLGPVFFGLILLSMRGRIKR